MYVRWELAKLDDSIAGLAKWRKGYTVDADTIDKASGPLEYTFVQPPKTTPTSIYKPAVAQAPKASPVPVPVPTPAPGQRRAAEGSIEIKTVLKSGQEYDAAIRTLSTAELITGQWHYRLKIQSLVRTAVPPRITWLQMSDSKHMTTEIARWARNYPSEPMNLIEPYDRTFLSQNPPRLIFTPLILVKPDSSQGSMGLVPAYVPLE